MANRKTARDQKDASETMVRHVLIEGRRPFLFDRYTGLKIADAQACRPIPQQQKEAYKGLWAAADRKTLVFPLANMMSLIAGKQGRSAMKRVVDKGEYGNVSETITSSLEIKPMHVPFSRNGSILQFTGWVKDEPVTEDGLLTINEAKGRVKGTVLMEYRAELDVPWTLDFKLRFQPTAKVSGDHLKEMFVEGTRHVGLGGYRPYYGTADLTLWEKCKWD